MNLELARTQMVEQQLRPWEVLDSRVLDVMSEIPREHFVPEPYQKLAFADTSIPLGHDQMMLAPSVQGRMLQALDVQTDARVLEIGTGSGFTAACMARLGGELTTVDIFPDFIDAAGNRLHGLGCHRVALQTLDATELEPDGRFDVIAITASLPVYIPDFERALQMGGRLFVITGEAPVMQATLVSRVAEHEWIQESLFETVAPAMINAPQRAAFVF